MLLVFYKLHVNCKSTKSVIMCLYNILNIMCYISLSPVNDTEEIAFTHLLVRILTDFEDVLSLSM